MPSVGIKELKANTSRIIKEINYDRTSYIVTYHGRPVAKLLPVSDREYDDYFLSTDGPDEESPINSAIRKKLAERRSSRYRYRSDIIHSHEGG